VKRAWRYLAVGAAAYLLILVVNFPASFIRDQLQAALPGLALGAVSGSVFSGHSSAANFEGFPLGTVTWRFRPQALLLLRMEYGLSFAHPDNNGRLNIGVGPGGSVHGSALDMQLAPAPLVNRFSPMELATSGMLNISLASFEIENGQLQELNGTADWQAAAIESPLVLSLGDIGLRLGNNADTIIGTVVEGGELGLSGDIVLAPAGRYDVDLLLRPADSVDAATRNLLASMMQANTSGDYILKTTGSF
jgi:hypothetical protein